MFPLNWKCAQDKLFPSSSNLFSSSFSIRSRVLPGSTLSLSPCLFSPHFSFSLALSLTSTHFLTHENCFITLTCSLEFFFQVFYFSSQISLSLSLSLSLSPSLFLSPTHSLTERIERKEERNKKERGKRTWKTSFHPILHLLEIRVSIFLFCIFSLLLLSSSRSFFFLSVSLILFLSFFFSLFQADRKEAQIFFSFFRSNDRWMM